MCGYFELSYNHWKKVEMMLTQSHCLRSFSMSFIQEMGLDSNFAHLAKEMEKN